MMKRHGAETRPFAVVDDTSVVSNKKNTPARVCPRERKKGSATAKLELYKKISNAVYESHFKKTIKRTRSVSSRLPPSNQTHPHHSTSCRGHPYAARCSPWRTRRFTQSRTITPPSPRVIRREGISCSPWRRSWSRSRSLSLSRSRRQRRRRRRRE